MPIPILNCLQAISKTTKEICVWPWQIKATLDRFYSFLVGGFDLSGKKAALIASCGESSPEAMDGLVFSFRKTIGLLKMTEAGTVLIPGLHEPAEYLATNAIEQTTELVAKF